MKNILLIGTGITGKSLYDYYKDKDVNLYIYDDKDFSGFEKAKKFDGNFNNIDFLVKSPGIKPNHRLIEEAEKLGIKVYSDLELAFSLLKTKNTVAVTGTNGKTTVTMLIGKILENMGKTYLAGNIGNGIFDCLDEISEKDYLVVECSSFQLAFTNKFHPHVGVITNITSDHLDWHGSLYNYQEAKKNIYKNMTSEDYLIINFDDPFLKTMEGPKTNLLAYAMEYPHLNGAFIKNNAFYTLIEGKLEKIMDTDKVLLKGDHNKGNILGAILVAKVYGVKNEIIEKTLMEFKGAPHRIEFVRKINGVEYYNDSKGTNPDSTDVALKAFKNIILIAGGYDKKSDFYEMLKNNKDAIKKMILLGATKDKLKNEGEKLNIPYHVVDDLEEAVNFAYKTAKKDDVVLLSPACASWDMFKNYEERGDKFKELVRNL